VLPLVPAVVGALAHQAGMIAERMSEDAAARNQAVEATPLRTRAAEPTSNAA
jgi:hypothetical protein